MQKTKVAQIKARIAELDRRYYASAFGDKPFEPGERERCDAEMERLQNTLDNQMANDSGIPEAGNLEFAT